MQVVSILPEGNPLWVDHVRKWTSRNFDVRPTGERGASKILQARRYGKEKLGMQE